MRASDHHPLLATQPALDAEAVRHVDLHYRARLGTLLSIDDMVAGLVGTIDELGIANDTFVFFTSDVSFCCFLPPLSPAIPLLTAFSPHLPYPHMSSPVLTHLLVPPFPSPCWCHPGFGGATRLTNCGQCRVCLLCPLPLLPLLCL